MIDGILLVDKEKDMTSYDIIRKLKRIIPRGCKIGHAGTLDPFATGLLIVLLGKCTKLTDKVHMLKKSYVVDAKLGSCTDTQDVTGSIIEESEVVVSREDFEKEVSKNFIGRIIQTPPRYSAVKIDGKRAYDLARKGEEFVIQPKEIEIFDFKVLDFNYPNVRCMVTCSTGTYVRTLINDIGKNLGCLATAVDLRRTSIGNFDVSDALRVSDLSEGVIDSIIPMNNVLEILNNG